MHETLESAPGSMLDASRLKYRGTLEGAIEGVTVKRMDKTPPEKRSRPALSLPTMRETQEPDQPEPWPPARPKHPLRTPVPRSNRPSTPALPSLAQTERCLGYSCGLNSRWQRFVSRSTPACS